MIYLNDDFNEGETIFQFLVIRLRFKADFLCLHYGLIFTLVNYQEEPGFAKYF